MVVGSLLVGNRSSLRYIYIYIYTRTYSRKEPQVCISIHIYKCIHTKAKVYIPCLNQTNLRMHLRMGQTVWRPENCPKISATGWEEGPAWVAYLDRLDFLNHYTVWHHQVGMKWIEPFKKTKAMIESLMIDSILEEVLPLACFFPLRWLGPPFEQLIEGSSWDGLQFRTLLMWYFMCDYDFSGGSSPHTVLSSSKGPTSWFRASGHGPGGFDRGIVILPLILDTYS